MIYLLADDAVHQFVLYLKFQKEKENFCFCYLNKKERRKVVEIDT